MSSKNIDSLSGKTPEKYSRPSRKRGSLRDIGPKGNKGSLELEREYIEKDSATIDLRDTSQKETEKPSGDIWSEKQVPLKKKKLNIKKATKKKSKEKQAWFQEKTTIVRRIGVYVLLIFVGCLMMGVFLLGYKLHIESRLRLAYEKLIELPTSGNIERDLDRLYAQFRGLDLKFAPVNLLANNGIYSNDQVASAYHVIKAGKHLTSGLKDGHILAQELVDVFLNEPENASSDLLVEKRSQFEDIYERFEKTLTHYEQVTSTGDSEIDQIFFERRRQLSEALTIYQNILENFDGFLEAIGHTHPKRVLVLNQNRDELRAGGGFPGSAVILDVYKGKIQNIELKDIYFFDWHLLYEEDSPEGINQFRASTNSDDSVNFSLRDANYYPTFSQSAQKINFFMEKSGFTSVDIVVGLHQGMIEKLLEITGPIYVEKIGYEIHEENFSIVFSVLVEAKVFAQNSPKDILFEFSEKLADKLQEQKAYDQYLRVLIEEVLAGEVVIASTDSEIQTFIDSLGIMERWRNDSGDWIYPIFTSLSRNKSDRYMHRDFQILRDQEDECLRHFTLKSRHALDITERLKIEKIFYELKIFQDIGTLLFVQGNGDNKQFVRLLAPAESILVDSKGYTISQEATEEFTQFSWYQDTSPAKNSEVHFSYVLPEKLCNQDPFMYKPPGLNHARFTSIDAQGNRSVHKWE